MENSGKFVILQGLLYFVIEFTSRFTALRENLEN